MYELQSFWQTVFLLKIPGGNALRKKKGNDRWVPILKCGYLNVLICYCLAFLHAFVHFLPTKKEQHHLKWKGCSISMRESIELYKSD